MAMKAMSGYFDAAYTAWLKAAVNCCSTYPALRQQCQTPTRDMDERSMRVEHHQPRLVAAPVPVPQEERPTTRGRERIGRTKSFSSRASSRGSFSVRRKLNAYNGPRRPQIGAPSDFRHVDGVSPPRTENFKPLELSIYSEQRSLSPILPHLETMDDVTPSAQMEGAPFPAMAVTHSRSDSLSSFTIARKPVRSSSRASSEWTSQYQGRPDFLSAQELLAKLENDLHQAPPRARLRSMTEPSTPTYERIKSALHEKYELEQKLKDIEEVIEERRSIYMNSRPSSRATSRAKSIYSEYHEPMPTPLSMQPSFAARMSSKPFTPTNTIIERRPKTAPENSHPSRINTSNASSSPLVPTPPPKSPMRYVGPPFPLSVSPVPPPPLPLVFVPGPQAKPIHPPLRRQKSFARVSRWLFHPADSHDRVGSVDSITNTPLPVTDSRNGFYQCVDVGKSYSPRRRDSTASISTVSNLSTITTTYTNDEHHTITPESSPGRKYQLKSSGMEKETGRKIEEGEKGSEPRSIRQLGGKKRVLGMNMPGRNSVGVAF